MNRIVTALLIMLASVTAGTPQQAARIRIHNGFLKAQEYLEMPQSGQWAYAMGLLDGIYLAPMLGAPDDNKLLVAMATCVEGMTNSQVAAIIEKHVKDHPERWHLDLKGVAFQAMRDACSIK